jgi:hypothetical protein
VNRSDGAPELVRGLLVVVALEVAEDKGGTVTFGKPSDLLINGLAKVRAIHSNAEVVACFVQSGAFALAAVMGARPGPRRDFARHLVEPGTEHFRPTERMGFADQHQERCLKSVLGIVRVKDPAPAYTQDHRPMARHQSLKRRLIAMSDKTLEQLRPSAVSKPAGPHQLPHFLENGRDH